MKRIINNKKYDTCTAKELGSMTNGETWTSFSFVAEKMYIKKTGEFFLYAEGGANSEYRQKCGTNTWSGGEEIIPLSETEAKEWACKYMSVNEYESLFGEVEE